MSISESCYNNEILGLISASVVRVRRLPHPAPDREEAR